MPKTIALLTAGHLSSCPRLIKEAELLSSLGYSLSVVYLESIPRISELDNSITNKYRNWNFYPVKWNNGIKPFFSKVMYELSNLVKLSPIYIQSTSGVLIDKVLSIKADLYIAHHPSVLAAAAMAAEKYNTKYAYDIEDAFPFVEDGRYINNPDNGISTVERMYINKAAFTTTASPLYSSVYKSIYLMDKNPLDLLNVFDINEEKVEYLDRKDLSKTSFYWYSQTIGLNRGLQDLFLAINSLPINSFELHLRGMCEEKVKSTLLDLVSVSAHLPNIFFHNTVSIRELEVRNKEHDIGFALEYSTSLNRDLCISNKILDYLRSGLMVVATSTQGHRLITEELNENALSYKPGDSKALSEMLQELLKDPDRIRRGKEKSLQLAREKYNWTIQSKNWINKIEEILK